MFVVADSIHSPTRRIQIVLKSSVCDAARKMHGWLAPSSVYAVYVPVVQGAAGGRGANAQAHERHEAHGRLPRARGVAGNLETMQLARISFACQHTTM